MSNPTRTLSSVVTNARKLSIGKTPSTNMNRLTSRTKLPFYGAAREHAQPALSRNLVALAICLARGVVQGSCSVYTLQVGAEQTQTIRSALRTTAGMSPAIPPVHSLRGLQSYRNYMISL